MDDQKIYRWSGAMKGTRIIAMVALGFLGLSGIVGAVPLLMHPSGEPWAMPQSLLQYSPFRSYLVPGILLLIANGLFSVWALWLTVSRRPEYGWSVIVQKELYCSAGSLLKLQCCD